VKFTVWDKELIQVALNLEYLEAEFFLWSSVGKGLDTFAPYLAKQGPLPIGVQKANLPPLLADTFFQFGLQEIGHLRSVFSSPVPSVSICCCLLVDFFFPDLHFIHAFPHCPESGFWTTSIQFYFCSQYVLSPFLHFSVATNLPAILYEYDNHMDHLSAFLSS
jgi:hypothetical protein